MSESKEEISVEKTGFVEVEFIKDHASREKGETEIYHISTAKALVDKLKVAKIIKKNVKYSPKNAAR